MSIEAEVDYPQTTTSWLCPSLHSVFTGARKHTFQANGIHRKSKPNKGASILLTAVTKEQYRFLQEIILE